VAWTTPLTAVANAALTAAQWNASVRDNLLLTAPALATTSGSYFAGTGANVIAQRIPQVATVLTQESSAVTTFGDNLTTVGPSVTVTSGATALVAVHSRMSNGTATSTARTGFVISGATTLAADADRATGFMSSTVGQLVNCSGVFLQTALTNGSNTFKMQYKADAGTGTWSSRTLAVLPF
jgi:hypothetical protein